MATGTLMAGLGAALALLLSTAGSAYGTVYAGALAVQQTAATGTYRERMLGFAPVIISGVVSIYGLIMAVIIAARITGSEENLSREAGDRLFCAGLIVGSTALVAGAAIGRLAAKLLDGHAVLALSGRTAKLVNEGTTGASAAGVSDTADLTLLDHEGGATGTASSVRASIAGPIVTVPVILVSIFIEALALYGLVAGLLISYEK
mmetsp:Transcript_4036/g.10203  ORF Transcript_4036/g.10203 Transcript_4036/m.10203 type:complete len:205 (-) Transcript_4036:401-1015(-)|eukprot:CAMPEP_0202037686 /NCGR_PEP_ID=MMETSP0962-20130828/2321_1 /ASSEMBLY_ACC=CAM_ASM_000488 /TAXON_ID=4773 /ORGANISM="Schizochytrium aggregatum, Strain ATCC28209" /LENGTH=204 /DNA_ID=CAMNT_0048601809 /DNA_START=38 /DNA_END=652 /DNA_ORIENTATION=+